MDIEVTSNPPRSINSEIKAKQTSAGRIKSVRRLRYDSEAQLIRNRHGALDDFRAQIGLSRRAICNLLLVDPSAWTRWTAPGGKAPPHIYRALEWYWHLMQKDPRVVVPIGTWGAQAYNERIRKLESDLDRLTSATGPADLSRARYAYFFMGLGLGILISLGIRFLVAG